MTKWCQCIHMFYISAAIALTLDTDRNTQMGSQSDKWSQHLCIAEWRNCDKIITSDIAPGYENTQMGSRSDKESQCLFIGQTCDCDRILKSDIAPRYEYTNGQSV